jgi:MoaA/NifB/PqqE/SkfB family radical SAM enzyme
VAAALSQLNPEKECRKMAESGLNPEEELRRNRLLEQKPLVYEKIVNFDKKHRKGESIATVLLQYRYACNFQCDHCCVKQFQRGEDRRLLSLDDVRNLSRQADEMGLARFIISGGEPLALKEFDALVAAIDPSKFFIICDTNGWFLNREKIEHLKEIGVDRLHLSIDSLDAEEHDSFRKTKGSHERAMKAIDTALDVGLGILVLTVLTKQRLHSEEFLRFLDYFTKKNVVVFVTYAKPVGSWEGKFDMLVDKEDMKYFRELEKKYKVCTHLTPAYGLSMGCIAVKGIIAVTQYGDVMPCPYIHVSFGNVIKEPLKEIIQRGLDVKYFGEHVDTCIIAEDRTFINDYLVKKIYNKSLPVPCSEVFAEEDRTKKRFNEE